MNGIRERVRNWTIATICRSERRKMEEEWEWIEWRRRIAARLALGACLAFVVFAAVKLVADGSRGGTYDPWAEAIGSALREART